MFNNPSDPMPCFLEIQAGAGGTEAQDWASMLLRMYLKYGEKKGFTVEVMEESEGEVAGIKSATVKFTGDYAYGTHRNRHPPPGPQVAVRLQRPPPYQLHLGVRLPGSR
jgi:peptide chain release factor 2